MMTRKKSSFRLPKLRLHKPTGQGCVELSGKIHYLGKYGSPQCEANYQNKLAAWLAAGRKPLVVNAPTDKASVGLTIFEVCERFLDFALSYYTQDGHPTRGIERAKMAVKILCEHFGRIQASDFSPLKLKHIQDALAAQDRARKYINSLTGQIKRIFKWAGSQEIVPASVHLSLTTVTGLKLGRGARESEPVKPVDIAIVKATLPHLSSIVAAMVQIQYIAGSRPQDVCNLRPFDIDRSGDIWLYRPRTHKNAWRGRERVIALNADAQAVLTPFLNRPATSYCFSASEAIQERRSKASSNRRTPLSCGNRPGTNVKKSPKRRASEKYNVESYTRAISRACRRAFVPPEGLSEQDLAAWWSKYHWSPNQLRHAAATEIRAQAGIEDAQLYLGHESPETTLRYAEKSIERLKDISRQRKLAMNIQTL